MENTILSLFPKRRRLLNFFPCESGDLESVVSYANRDETMASLMLVRNLPKLTLSVEPDIWDIKKTLKQSDIDFQARLIIPKETVFKHVRKYFTKEEINMIENEDNPGLMINVFDSNTESTHQLCLKRWKSSGSYVLNNNWSKTFVKRRGLKVGQEIGLFWNPYASRLHFRVLA